MRPLLALAVLAACGGSQTPDDSSDRGWYCFRASRDGASSSACYRDRSDCTAADTHGWLLTDPCSPSSIAYCLTDNVAPVASTCFATSSDCAEASDVPACYATN